MKPRFLVAAALLCFSALPGGAFAADEDAKIQALERKLDQSLQVIQQLSDRVKQLESGTAPQPAAAPAPQMAMPAMPGMMDASSPGVPFHGFADVGGGFQQHGRSGFTTGSLDIYLAPQFSDRVRALIEAVVEFDEDTGEPGIDLERSQIGYAFSDAATVWLGRFHSPFGYYNTAFHHGQLMQTSIRKPKFLDFEDKSGVMPSHTVGTWATGRLGARASQFSYDAYLGNSPTISGGKLDMNNLASRNNVASVGLNAAYLGMDGSLRIGGDYYRATVADDSVPANETRMSFAGPYGVFDDGVWEIMYEYYRFSNDNLASFTGNPTGVHHSFAWFAQLGRHFGQWMPYARYEKASFDQNDNYFALLDGGRSYKRALGGLRYDINPRAAFTVEANRTEQDVVSVPEYKEFRFQFAIGF